MNKNNRKTINKLVNEIVVDLANNTLYPDDYHNGVKTSCFNEDYITKYRRTLRAIQTKADLINIITNRS